ncbi:hypothetical protein B4135_1324 [Caldibacillus debilis]|uniref:Uncharacterized protein n=1 Tax=Caldibacillus debilis TaxID=301148 RepID=A0A150MCI5_9BACI|nr:hypothetical protein B4135_1324 [Caldibacillus debilis]
MRRGRRFSAEEKTGDRCPDSLEEGGLREGKNRVQTCTNKPGVALDKPFTGLRGEPP